MRSEERLHPASILFSFGKSLKAFAVPGLVGLVIAARRPGPNVDAWMMLFLIPAAIVAIVRYLSFRLRYEGTELVIRSGIIFRNERHIPYARIQNLDAVQNVFHRLLRVIEVRVETGAGSEPEATISVLPASALDEMRRRVFAREPAAGASPQPAPRLLLELPFRELLLHGFLVNRGMVVIGALYGVLWELGMLDRFSGARLGDDGETGGLLRNLMETIANGRTLTLVEIALAAGGILVFLIVVRVLSMCWAVIRLFGFRLMKAGDDLRIDFGLFTRVTATIPVRRIQSITIRHGPLYRLVDRVSVRVETAGGRTREETAASAREWLAPLIRQSGVAPLVAEVLGEEIGEGGQSLPWQPVHPGAFRRAVKRRLFGAAVLCVPVAVVAGWWAVAFAGVALPWSIYAARRYVDHLAWAAGDSVVAFRSGWLWRHFTLARISRAQTVTLIESPFDRRTAMARVRVDTAGADERSHRIDIPYLDKQCAMTLQGRLATLAADTAFHW